MRGSWFKWTTGGSSICRSTFTGLKAALEVRDEVKDILDLQIVACPQEGMYAYKSGDELVEEGLKMGADCVGAIPHFELKLTFA